MLCRPELPAPALQAAAAAAAGCVRHDEPPPACAAPSLSPCACAGRVDTHTGQHGIPVCRLGMEDMQSLGCFLKLLLLLEVGCACCPARRSSSARVAARWPSGSGVLGVLKNLHPLKNPRQEPGRRVAVDIWWSAQRLPARCVRAGSARCPVCAPSRRHARASLALAACSSQRSHSSLVLSETPLCPPHALRTNACSLACSALCAPSAHSLMSVLAVSPRPRKGLLTLSSLPHQLCQVRADGLIRHARDDSAPRRCAWRSRCRRRRGRRR